MNGPYFGALKTMDQIAHHPLRSQALELHQALEGEMSERAKSAAAAFLEIVADDAEATPSQKFIAASVKNVYEHTRKQTRQAPVADSDDHIVPGHDPLVLDRYPPPAPELAGIVAALHLNPTTDTLDTHPTDTGDA